MSLTVSVHQTRGHAADAGANLRALDDIPAAAADHGAHLLILPELWLSGYNIGARMHALAEPRDGPATGAATCTTAA